LCNHEAHKTSRVRTHPNVAHSACLGLGNVRFATTVEKSGEIRKNNSFLLSHERFRWKSNVPLFRYACVRVYRLYYVRSAHLPTVIVMRLCTGTATVLTQRTVRRSTQNVDQLAYLYTRHRDSADGGRRSFDANERYSFAHALDPIAPTDFRIFFRRAAPMCVNECGARHIVDFHRHWGRQY